MSDGGGMSDEDAHGSAAADAALLDARGLLCPLPVIRTQDRVRTLTPGTVLEVLATDPGVLHDIPAWCRVHGHEVIDTSQSGREIRVRLRVMPKSTTQSRPSGAPSLRN